MSQPVFLSSVTKEFPGLRELLATDLRRTEAEVRDQEHFRHLGGLLLQMLDDYIIRCHAVIHLIGVNAGIGRREDYTAKPDEVAFILAKYPDFTQRFPSVAPHIHELSYTQWEAWLALYHGRKLFVWVYAPNTATGDPPFTREPSQQRHLELLQARGQFWPSFLDVDHLRREVLISLHDILKPRIDHQPNNLPYQPLGTLFKGRDKFLEQVQAKFQAGANVVGVLTPVAAQAVHGLGGVGKTRAAVEFAWRHQTEFSALLFVTADSPDNLDRNLAELVGPFVLDIPEAQQAREQSVRVAAALRWLQEHPGWCLIIDNVDTEPAADAVQQLFAQLTQGRVLITSRLSKWRHGVEKLELDVLAPEDARDYLLEATAGDRFSTPQDATLALAIAGDLDGLALALEQAAAYIEALGLSFAQYRERWETKREELLKYLDGVVMTYPRSLAVTWNTSFAELTPAARLLLEHLAWFAPDPIPMFVFDDAKPGQVWAELLPGDVHQALAQLNRYSLAKRDGATISVHRLVQEITRGRIAEDERVVRISGVLNVLDKSDPGDPHDVRTWPRWEPLAPHYLAATTFADATGIAEPTARLLSVLGTLFHNKAYLAQAEPLFRRVLAIDEQSYGADHHSVASDLGNLAGLLLIADRSAEAEPLLLRALEIDEQRGDNHPMIALRLNNLAQMYMSTYQFDKSESLLRRSLTIQEANLDTDSSGVVVGLINLAGILLRTDRLEEAEPLVRRGLIIQERDHCVEDPRFAKGLNMLAQICQKTDRMEEAERLLRRALAIDEKVYGGEHYTVANRLHNLGMLMYSTNRLAEAELLLKRALLAFQTSLGPEHQRTKVTAKNYRLLQDDIAVHSMPLQADS